MAVVKIELSISKVQNNNCTWICLDPEFLYDGRTCREFSPKKGREWCGEMKILVKLGNLFQGRGLFATKPFASGDVLFTETPLLSSQFSWNEAYQYLACENCMRPLETAEANAQRLANDRSLTLPYADCCITVPWLDKHTKCAECGAKYCSEECRTNALAKYHAYICKINLPTNNQPISELVEVWKKMHYPPETTTLMLIVKIFAIYKQTDNKEQFLALLNDFQQTAGDEETQLFHKLLGDKFTAQLEELYNGIVQVFSGDPELQLWLTPDSFKKLFILIGTNGQGVGTTAVGEWAKRVGNLEKLSEEDKKKLEQAIDDLYMKMDDFSGQFLNVEGSALYSQQSKINHSCEPNCEILFPQSNHILQVTALRDIPAGEEVTISYLDECVLARSRHSRQKVLKENYIFICECERCVREATTQKDVTSSEEESEDDDEEEMED